MADDSNLQQVVFDTTNPSNGFYAAKVAPTSGGGGGCAVYAYDIPANFTIPQASSDVLSTVFKIPLPFATGSTKAPHRVSLLTDMSFDQAGYELNYMGYRLTDQDGIPVSGYAAISNNYTKSTSQVVNVPKAASQLLPIYVGGTSMLGSTTNTSGGYINSTLNFVVCPTGTDTATGDTSVLPKTGNGIIRLEQGITYGQFGASGAKTFLAQQFVGLGNLTLYNSLELVVFGTARSAATPLFSQNKIVMTVS